MPRTSAQNIGDTAESEACAFLQKNGLKLIKQNFRSKAGEIDLIMQDGKYLVFVEVRYRKKTGYGDGLESVTKSKQQKIIRAAKYYLQLHNFTDSKFCRFDVVASDPEKKMVWLKDAFWVKY